MERHYCKANETLELVGQAGKCKFVVYDMIGKGTMSVGYRAFMQAPDRSGWRSLYEFCPKALRAGSIVYEREKQRFLRNLAFQYRTEFAGGRAEPVFPSSAIFEDPRTGNLWAEADWIDSRPLSSALEETASLSSLLKIMLHLLDAMDEYHDRGFLLLSLKPQNIRIVNEGNGKESIRILDFGSMVEKSVVADKEKRQNSLISFNRKWSAPELLRMSGRVPIDEKADIFSAGAVLYSCLCGGRLPALYSDVPLSLNRDMMVKDAASGAIESSTVIRRSINGLLSGMLDCDPLKRPDAAAVHSMINGIISELSKACSTPDADAGSVSGMQEPTHL